MTLVSKSTLTSASRPDAPDSPTPRGERRPGPPPAIARRATALLEATWSDAIDFYFTRHRSVITYSRTTMSTQRSSELPRAK